MMVVFTSSLLRVSIVKAQNSTTKDCGGCKRRVKFGSVKNMIFSFYENYNYDRRIINPNKHRLQRNNQLNKYKLILKITAKKNFETK